MKPKTLNELETLCTCKLCKRYMVGMDDLKAEAVKWVKDDDFSTEELLERWNEFKISNDIVSSMAAIKLWIKHFFNITRKDLK